MEAVTAVRKRLLADPSVTGYVANKVYKHRLEKGDDGKTPLAGTGGRAIVVKLGTSWSQPDNVQSSEYPIVLVEIHADENRDDGDEITMASAEEGAMSVYRVVDPILHGKRGEWWGVSASNPGFLVMSCKRWSEPIFVNPRRALADPAILSVPYAIHTAHGSMV